MTQSAGKRAKRAQKIFEKAVAAHRAGRLDEALGGYAEAVERDPQSSQAYNNMGVALRAQGAFHAAVASYRRASRSNQMMPAAIPISATRYAHLAVTARRKPATVKRWRLTKIILKHATISVWCSRTRACSKKVLLA